jgi:hypothetical protein
MEVSEVLLLQTGTRQLRVLPSCPFLKLMMRSCQDVRLGSKTDYSNNYSKTFS